MKAIETKYKWHRFRSRFEARWAVFFDHLGIKWEYEIEGFDLGNGVRYLPDFWLPDMKYWIEIKPEYPTADEKIKAEKLCLQTHNPVYIFYGQFDPDPMNVNAIGFIFREGGKQYLVLGDGNKPELEFKPDHVDATDHYGWTATEQGYEIKNKYYYYGGWGEETLYEAHDAARQARFEFGETG